MPPTSEEEFTTLKKDVTTLKRDVAELKLSVNGDGNGAKGLVRKVDSLLSSQATQTKLLWIIVTVALYTLASYLLHVPAK